MIKTFEQFKIYFYLYLFYKDCNDDEEELYFDLDYLRKRLSLFLLSHPIILKNNEVINNLDDLIMHYILFNEI